MKYLCVALCLCCSVFATAQNNIDLSSLPEVESYIVTRTNPSADTVIIGLHGGPSDQLYPGDFIFFETISTFSVVEMEQYQHVNQAVLGDPTISFDEAILYNDTTVAMLKKTVNYFRDQNKTVVLIGHSFGAFILAEYIDDYGMADVHRIIPMAGRLNMNQEVWENFANGIFAGFDFDGITVLVDPFPADTSDWAAMQVAAGIGYNRWADSLLGIDLSRLMYIYATNDESVGQLLPDELATLNAGNARILEIIGGDHGSPFDNINMVQVLAFIREELSVGLHTTFAKADVQMFPTVVKSNLTVNAKKAGQLTVLNSAGSVVMQQSCTVGQQQIATNHLPQGMYVAAYRTVDGEIGVERIIVQ